MLLRLCRPTARLLHKMADTRKQNIAENLRAVREAMQATQCEVSIPPTHIDLVESSHSPATVGCRRDS